MNSQPNKRPAEENPGNEEGVFEMKLYRDAQHPKNWVAYVPEHGWVAFPAKEHGWEHRAPARGLDPLYLREVPRTRVSKPAYRSNSGKWPEGARHSLAGSAGIVAAQAIQFAAELGPAQHFDQSSNARQVQMLAADGQVVPLAEVAAQSPGRTAGPRHESRCSNRPLRCEPSTPPASVPEPRSYTPEHGWRRY